MKEQSPGYPDLDEASNRNNLKRLPRLEPLFFQNKKDGREGHYDIKQRGGGVQAWFMPSFDHELFFDVSRIYSESIEFDQDLWRNHLEASLNWSPIYDLDFVFGLGVESPGNNFGNTFLYNFKVNGRIGDSIKGYLGLSQDVVDDTVEALKKVSGQQNMKQGSRLTCCHAFWRS